MAKALARASFSSSSVACSSMGSTVASSNGALVSSTDATATSTTRCGTGAGKGARLDAGLAGTGAMRGAWSNRDGLSTLGDGIACMAEGLSSITVIAGGAEAKAR